MTATLSLPTTGELCVMDRTGDTKMIWNPNNTDEVEAAQATFDRLKKKGYLAYKVTAGGEKGEVITRFDASAEKIIMAPPVVGG